jgi:DNA-binding transcriptional regulator YiaG
MSKLPTMSAEEMVQIRDTMKVSQREMADLLGVDLRSYQRWEYGERKVPGPAVLLSKRILLDHVNVTK